MCGFHNMPPNAILKYEPPLPYCQHGARNEHIGLEVYVNFKTSQLNIRFHTFVKFHSWNDNEVLKKEQCCNPALPLYSDGAFSMPLPCKQISMMKGNMQLGCKLNKSCPHTTFLGPSTIKILVPQPPKYSPIWSTSGE